MAARRKASTGAPPARKKKKSGCLPWFLVLFFLLFLLVLLLVAAVFGRNEKPVKESAKVEDLGIQMRVSQRVVKEILSGKPAESTIRLNPAEMAALLRGADTTSAVVLTSIGKQNALPERKYLVKFANGKFDILYPLETKYKWLLGGVIWADLSFEPAKDGDTFHLKVYRFKLGYVPIPVKLVERSIDELIKRKQSEADYQRFNRYVKTMKIDDDTNFVVTYRPAEVRNDINPQLLRVLQ